MRVFHEVLLKSAALPALLIFGLTGHANANYAFSGSGSSGYLDPSVSGEPWEIPAQSGAPGWGSPGISYGITAYTQSEAAYGLDITFTGGGEITPGSIAIGNGAGCAGDTTGGTTFCTISPTNIWEAFQTGPNSVDFRAQNASFNITQGEEYFVNVLYTGAAPTSFTGVWLTSFSPGVVPEPATWLLFGCGMMGLAAVREFMRRRSSLA
jgi:hypothetical protein